MAPRRQVAGLAAVIATGKRRESLEALRDHLAQELENAPAGIAIGPIAKELRTVMAELDSMPDGKESTVDDLAKRRASRRAAAAGQ
jgi:hypothetical protein